jgi:hypothetical protein
MITVYENVEVTIKMAKVTYRDAGEIVTALGEGPARDVNWLRGSCNSIAVLIRQYAMAVRDVLADPRMRLDAQPQEIANLRSQYSGGISAVETQAKGKVSDVRQAIYKLLQEPSNTQEAILRQLEIQQGYQRIQLHLASGDDLLDVARKAGESGDRPLITAFRAYAVALTADKPKSLADGLLRVLDQAETPFLSEAALTARDVQDELTTGVGLVGGCANMARAIVSGEQGSGFLLSWYQGRSIQVDGNIPGVPAGAFGRGPITA